MKSLPRYTQTQVDPSQQNNVATDTLTGCIIISLPIILVLIVTGYRKYKAQVRRRRIAHIEKMWRLSPEKKTP
jgi:hypothetical protein